MNNPYELMYMSFTGDEYAQKALFKCYENELRAYVNTVICRYRPLQIYRDDLMQEMQIAFWNAVYAYREDKRCSLRTFVHMVTERRIQAVLRSYCGGGRVSAHEVIPYDPEIAENRSFYENVRDRNRMNEPEYAYRFALAGEKLVRIIGSLSTTDRMVMEAWMNEESYAEASSRIGLSYKQYDGRLQRIRRKIRNAVIQEG